ncbi:HEAT repeat-containing protein 5A [Clonorchis sinensis]|uniref:HEAT repeat-containing protein 5A n=1 Tax=Clonorchis sinensis TaxID=79923 RepID=G7Y644_CLOSI|nr:HEAT repeat-containing protein 5A [Clonorchis sinensis]
MCESLLLDDTLYERLSEVKKPVFIFDWLRSLEKALPNVDKKAIREVQEDLVQQLLTHLSRSPSFPTHKLIGRCLAKLFLVGDTLLLYTTVNTCNSLLKSRDDGASTTNGRLAALTCLGTVYKCLGRMIGRSFDDSVALIVKLIKQSESQVRCEAMNTLCSLLEGVGSAASASYKEIYKAAKSCMTDRVLSVRVAAAKCMNELANHYAPIHANELEATVSLCFRCMDGSNYAVRLEVAKLLGNVLARSQQSSIHSTFSGLGLSAAALSGSASTSTPSRSKTVPLNDALALLATGFLKGPGGFLKGTSASDMIKGTNSVNREVRIGVTYAYVEFVTRMGARWFESNLTAIVTHCVNLLANPRATTTHAEAIYSRHCIGYILGTLYRSLLSETVQLVAARELATLARQRLQNVQGVEVMEDAISTDSSSTTWTDSTTDLEGKPTGPDLTELEDEQNGGPEFVSKATDPDSTFPKRTFGRSLAKAQRQQQQQHTIVSILDQLTLLVRWLDSTSAPLLDEPSHLADLLCAALTHPIAPVRLAAAVCLRQLTIALPGQRVILLDRCINCLHQAQRSHGDAILGYSAAIAGILAGASLDNLGLPGNRAKQVFSLAEELLRAANQNSRLTLPRTQAGWMMLAAYMTLGPDLVRPHLPRMLLFWRNAFTRSLRELEAEKQRGDAFTWQVMLEARAGALCSMQSFLECCAPMLITEEAVSRLLAPIECALNMLAHLLDIVRIYGNHLKAIASMIRHRLYRILLLLPHTAYTSSYSTLLRELVAEFTLTDNVANTTTSLLRSLCRSDDSVTLGCWIQDTDQKILEEQLQPNIGGAPGALEHDPAFLFLRDGLVGTVVSATCPSDSDINDGDSYNSPLCSPSASFYDTTSINFPSLSRLGLPTNVTTALTNSTLSVVTVLQLGGPPPISVAVIDSAVELFGRIFPAVPIRHRAQMVDHFAECIRLTKSTRQEAVQINVFAALLGALRRLAETKVAFGEDVELRKSTANLIMTALTSSSLLLRCTAGECLGRLAQIVAEPSFLAELAQQVFDRLRSVRIPLSRAGHCLAVGCLHRYVGGLASGQHLSTSVGVLLAIAQDSSVPEVQVWAIHALALVADSGGPMFREFVGPSLNLVLQLLLRSPSAVSDIQHSLGRLLSALITTLGPELQGSGPSVTTSRQACWFCCLIMQESSDAMLQAEAVSCLQRLHMFASQQMKMPELVASLQNYMSSPHLLLRRAAVAYLRQLSQKGTDCFQELTDIVPVSTSTDCSSVSEPSETTPLLLQLFGRLDVETDVQARRDIEETILSFLQSSFHHRLKHWLNTLKEVLQAATSEKSPAEQPSEWDRTAKGLNANISPARSSASRNQDFAIPAGEETQTVEDDAQEDDTGVGDTLGGATQLNAPVTIRLNARWGTKVFAVGCLRVVITSCYRLAQTAAKSSPAVLVCIDGTMPHHATNSVCEPMINRNAVAHFDLALARCLRASKLDCATPTQDFLVLHLADLVRIAFMSATSDSDRLRMAGLKLMLEVIHRFSSVPDPEFPGHSILEQYQAQVSAALRPAFSHLSPEITSIASLVCSAWLVSGVAGGWQDLQRAHSLLQEAFENCKLGDLKSKSDGRNVNPQVSQSSQLYSDDAICMEKLAILRAWASVYVACAQHGRQIARDGQNYCEDIGVQDEVPDGVGEEENLPEDEPIDMDDGPQHLSYPMAKCGRKQNRRTFQLLLTLLQPLLPTLSKAWFAALQDYALLNLPDELAAQRPSNGGAFFGPDANVERIRFHYLQHWSTFVSAVSIWTENESHRMSDLTYSDTDCQKRRKDNFDLLLGLCVQSLCDPILKQSVPLMNTCLQSLRHLLSRPEPRMFLICNYPDTPLELLHVLYRLVLTRDNVETHLLSLSLVSHILIAAQERLVKQREAWLSEDASANRPKVFLTPETNKTPAGGNMTSSVFLQTTSLVDLEMYELSEGGTLESYVSEADRKPKGEKDVEKNPDVKLPSVGLQANRSIVLACLEIVTCTLARYRPEILAHIPDLENIASTNDRTHTVPETRCASNPNAPYVLAAAVQCLIPMSDLCAPRVLLSEFNTVGQPVVKEDNADGAATNNCTDNLLQVLLELLVRTSRTALLKPFGGALSWFDDQHNRPKPMEDAVDFQAMFANNVLDLFGLSDPDTQITSTATSSRIASAARRQRFDNDLEKRRIDSLVGWTPQQSCLADVLARLAIKLATHHYPTLTTSRISASALVNHKPAVDQINAAPSTEEAINGNQPDSSSTVDYTGVQSGLNGTALPCGDSSNDWHNNPINQAAPSVWYDSISSALLDLLHHDHPKVDEPHSWTCCLGAVTLVTRIAVHCPLDVFKSRELRVAITTQICRTWKLADSETTVNEVTGDLCAPDGHSVTTQCQGNPNERQYRLMAALRGFRKRRICLAAIELLINHQETAVNMFFVRTLVPQIFRWLSDLSLVHILPAPTTVNEQRITKDELSNSLHAAMDILESLIDITTPENRQGLLLIIVPLLCSLLSQSLPTTGLTSRWLATDTVTLNSSELKCGLHLLALKHLISMAPRFPLEFRSVLGALGELKPRLEAAIKHSASPLTAAQVSSGKPSHLIDQCVLRTGDRPVIQLKTDFSNFGQD